MFLINLDTAQSILWLRSWTCSLLNFCQMDKLICNSVCHELQFNVLCSLFTSGDHCALNWPQYTNQFLIKTKTVGVIKVHKKKFQPQARTKAFAESKPFHHLMKNSNLSWHKKQQWFPKILKRQSWQKMKEQLEEHVAND